MYGSGVLAALAVQMGTAFVTSLESGATNIAKEALLSGDEEQTVVTSTFSGKPARGIKNDFIIKMKAYENGSPPYPIQNTLTPQFRSEAAKQNRSEWMSLWCGQNLRSTKHQSATETMSEILSQVDEIVKTLETR